MLGAVDTFSEDMVVDEARLVVSRESVGVKEAADGMFSGLTRFRLNHRERRVLVGRRRGAALCVAATSSSACMQSNTLLSSSSVLSCKAAFILGYSLIIG